MYENYTHKKGLVYLNQYHIVFCPKYRRKVLVGDIEKDLKQIFYEIAKEKDVEIKALEVMPDYVHMFISVDPRQPLHELIRLFKGRSSRILRDKYPELKSRIPSLWTRSYFCCTIGNVSEEVIQQYIENQKHV
ncbi:MULTISPECIES: IS200/IS605 family transposase [Clostridium]|jgi:putative transposase|uniref:IS200/IS605 family transposase n=1 Tax=Clostridium TaxID=1485 RepID=UPI000E8CD928|nr:IS200/IS605 family transposase [Clostridium tyrobutyricum]HBF78253.1 IS200/IS605 family transposase [Clostridiaceae bacterium]